MPPGEPPFLLDTSALLAHFSMEPGWTEVEEIFASSGTEVFVCAVSWLEFQVRLKPVTSTAELSRILSLYEQLVAKTVPLTKETAFLAFELRQASKHRLPNMDAFIAAAAKLSGATLIHRDSHFTGIPPSLLRQHSLERT